MDTDITPLGEGAWGKILTHIREMGDEAETNYLEVKSALNLASTPDVAKVAKFLLGAANRRPRDAARHFQGYAVMVIGAQQGSVDGVARGVEAHELKGRLDKYLGQHFPGFEFGRITVDDDREVLFVIALPPQDGQAIFACHKNFHGEKGQERLDDGAIYVRGLSNTETAKAGDVLALVERARGGGKPPIDLDIAVLGSINRVEHIDFTMEKLYELREDKFTKESPPSSQQSATSSVLFPPGPPASRPVSAERRAELLEAWKRKKTENMAQGREHLLGVALPGAGIRVTSDRFINKPHLTITFHQCEAFDHYDIDDAEWDTLVEPIMPQQQPYGMRNLAQRLAPRDYPVSWSNRGSNVEVILRPESFRPNSPWESDQNDYVLLARDPSAQSVTATWTLTEEGSDKTTADELDIPLGEPTEARQLVKAAFIDPET
ncbi:hypothetical protein, partial [Arthrobacter castelli]|uniref:hypothetical protein n=1 Tax=Arthrobacter castelli TaxID=271431 RepID=UPI0004143ACA